MVAVEPVVMVRVDLEQVDQVAEEMVEVAKSQILLQTATDSLTKHNRLSVDVDRTLMGLSGGM